MRASQPSFARFAAARSAAARLLALLGIPFAGTGFAPELRAQLVRLPNASLSLPPSLPSGTYSSADALSGLRFIDPLALATPPGESRRLFVVEQAGRISLVPDPAAPTRETFLDIRSRVRSGGGEEGLLGLAFHPGYHVAGGIGEGLFFVTYTTTIGGNRHWRLSRFSVQAGNPDRADPNSEVPLLTQRDLLGNHNGGDVHFGDDGYLYVSTGDEGGANDQNDHGQHIDKSFFAAILRLDVDRRPENLEPNGHPAVHPGTYKVPADNPFVGANQFNGLAVDPGEVRTEFWAVGLRNPWRMSFDRPTGRLFVADVGQGAREEINILSPAVFASNGGVPNYGWSFREGGIAFPAGPGGATPPSGFSAIEPIHDYPHSQGRSVTGGLVYRGARYPELFGDYLFADYVSGRIWAMTDPGGPGQAVTQIASQSQIAGFGLDPATGDVLLARNNNNRTEDDPLLRLVRSPAAGAEPPALLSETGAFRSLATLEPEPGIVPYEINAPFWSDHAEKRRWFSIPDPALRMEWSQEGHWTFPAGQIWIKHFELDLDRDAPGTQRTRLETRFLVKTDDDVYGLTYRWNESQTEAFLVGEEGANADYTVVEGGAARTQTWRFPSRSECRTCHNPAAGWALGFGTRQLNRTVDHGEGSFGQLGALAAAGYFENAVPDAAGLPAHAPPHDPAFSLEDRVRSYLASNCAACHQSGAVGMGAWSARADLSLAASGLVGSTLLNNAGDPHKRTLVPGDPGRSMILERMRNPRTGSGTLSPMPPLASNEIDEAGAALLEEWLLSTKKILFVRGADRSGGFLSAANDNQRTEHLSDIENTTSGSPNHGWAQLADALRGEGFVVEQVKEGAETTSGPSQGTPVPFESMNLDQYRVIVFGSNNAVYGAAAIDAVDAWIRGGGGALFLSDANFGGDWADAADSDQQFLGRFGLVMNQDAGTYVRSRASGHFLLPDHPVFEGVESFGGEGVSPVSIGSTPPDVSAAVAASAQGQVRRNQAPFGSQRQGATSPAAAADGALVLAEAGEGRIAGHYDRNTFFNQGGIGSDLTRNDNRRYALNLFRWLAEGSPPDPAAPTDFTASAGTHLDRIALAWIPGQGAEAHTIYRSGGGDFADAQPLAVVGGAASSYDDDSTEPGASWRYWVTATHAGQESAPAGPAEGWRAVAPPAGLTASDATRDDRIDLAWEPVAGATYRLYRGTGPDFAGASPLVSTGGLSHSDLAATTVAGLAYRYWIAALRNGRESAPTGPATGRRALVPASAPQASTGVGNGIALAWTASSDATVYRILRHTSDDFASASLLGSTAATEWLDTSAGAGIDFFYWIVAANAQGESPPTSGAAGRRTLLLHRPDLGIGRSPGSISGLGAGPGEAGHVLSVSARRRRPMRAHFELRNAGNVEDRFRVFASRGTANFRIRYLRRLPGFADLTALVVDGRHFAGPLAPGDLESGAIEVRPVARRRDRRLRRTTVSVQAFSVGEPARNDRILLRAASRP